MISYTQPSGQVTKIISQDGVSFQEDDATAILRSIMEMQREYPDNRLEEIVFQKGNMVA